jgi:hypothetical protein
VHALVLSLLVWPLLHAGLWPEPRAVLPRLQEPPAADYRVLVVDWGLHTAIVVEQPAGWKLGPPDAEAAPFLEYAWGDRRYFAAGERGPGALLGALFLPTQSALLLRGHGNPPPLTGREQVLERRVDRQTLHALLTSLERSFTRDGAGERAGHLPRSAGQPGTFYPALGTYHWSRNCNSWTVRRLAEAGLARPGRGVLFPFQVTGLLRGFRSQQRPPLTARLTTPSG